MQLGDFTIAEMQSFFACSEWTSVALCQAYLERIAEIDRAGPNLRSVLELNPDALKTAEACDRARQSGAKLSPLSGIPILVRDSIDTADRTMTTAGSIAMIGNIATSDAFIVKRLREAGAVILGKANMTEWSYMRSLRTSPLTFPFAASTSATVRAAL